VKAKASEEALAVTEACIQLHGAIGFADEHDIGLSPAHAALLFAGERRRAATPLCGSPA
jgi:alkylation response protein AidB-like acyl-CoA dehydrogenase